MGQVAPIAQFTLAFAMGVGWGLFGVPLWLAPLPVLLCALWPIPTSARPDARPPLAIAVLAGVLSATLSDGGGACPPPRIGQDELRMEGRFLVTPRDGSAPFERADGCGVFTVVVSVGGLEGVPSSAAGAGLPATVVGRWREGARKPWFLATRVNARHEAGRGDVRWATVRWRDGLIGRLHRLYGSRAPLVSALTLARREGMDRDLRDAFATAGIAHLLAISGFHVGVIAGIALTLLRALRVSRRSAALGAAGLSWAYVALIGFPDAACRAALMLALLATSRVRGRPPTRWGALATGALALLALEPGRLGAPGFQLSFAGAAALIAWAGPLARVPWAWTRTIPHGWRTALAAGVAATLGTLPIAAWHFGRVSLIGIPMTLLATPLVSLALPGALVSLAVDFVSHPLASFFAGGVTILLDLLHAATTYASSLPGVSVWTTRTTVVAGGCGVWVAAVLARRPGIGGATRRKLAVLYVMTGCAAWPLLLALEGRGTLEIVMIDVGQGDAIAVRTPASRWLLVDAGPPVDGDSGAHAVVRALRARGVAHLDFVVLTHPDLDHIGGAVPVLEHFTVGRILDPALPAPKASYVEVLETAGRLEVPWSAATVGTTLELDGVTLKVLHPSGGSGTPLEANAASVVLLLEWRGFRALLTGDAYVDVERALADGVGDIDVLKVGHHGSDTSTDSLFLARTTPEVALISVGRRNRYGHPHPSVVHRLAQSGAEIRRTDEEGSVTVTVGKDGRLRARSERD